MLFNQRQMSAAPIISIGKSIEQIVTDRKRGRIWEWPSAAEPVTVFPEDASDLHRPYLGETFIARNPWHRLKTTSLSSTRICHCCVS
jgi:hypothetical protein